MKRTLLFLVILVWLPNVSPAHPGWGLVVDSKRNVFFCDVNRNIIWKIGQRGKVTSFVTGKHSHAIAIDAKDNIYGEHVQYDSRNDRWLTHRWMADQDGRVSVVDSKTVAHFFHPVDHKGNKYLFISDAHKKTALVKRETSKGDTILFVGERWGDSDGRGSRAQFRTFGPAVFGSDSALYVASGGIIRRITPEGEVTTLAGARQGFGDPDEPRASGFLGIACDKERNIYAAHWEKKIVIRIGRDGSVKTILDSGTLWSPSGVLARGDDLYILEHRAGVTGLLEKAGFGGPRVRKIDKNGAISLIGVAP